MHHTVYARIAGNQQARNLIAELARAGIARDGIRVVDYVARASAPLRARVAATPILAVTLAGTALGILLSVVVMAWWWMPLCGAAWGALLGAIVVACRADVPATTPVERRTRIEIDTRTEHQTARVERICTDHRAWSTTGL